MSTARYRLLFPDGDRRKDGEAEVEVRDGMLVLAPSGGSVLPIPFGHMVSVTEPEPFTVRLTLAGGDVIELGRLGVMRTQLRDGRGDAAATAAVGEAEAFAAFAAGGAAEVRVYDDAPLVIGAGGSERIAFSFAGAVRVRDYAVTVEVTGREPVILTRLGRRTGELAELLPTRIREASVRTAAFLAALLPGLDPMAVRAAAGLNSRALRPMAGRPDVTQRLLTPATEDLATLTVTGKSPTVLAFALAAGSGGVAYEVLNQAGPATYVFRGDLAAVNRALDDAGFDAEALAASRGLAPAGRVPHDAGWAGRIAALLG